MCFPALNIYPCFLFKIFILEFTLDEAYRSFNASAAAFLENNAGLDSSGPASKEYKIN